MKMLFKQLYQISHKKYPEIGYEIIGGFFFLRFFCPILVSPEKYSLINCSSFLSFINLLLNIIKLFYLLSLNLFNDYFYFQFKFFIF